MTDTKEIPWKHTRLIEELDALNMDWAWDCSSLELAYRGECECKDRMSHTKACVIPLEKKSGFASWWFDKFTDEVFDEDENCLTCEVDGTWECPDHHPGAQPENDWPRWMDSDAFGRIDHIDDE